MADYETLLLSIENGLATLTLNRPEKLNALNKQLKSDLLAAIRHISHKHSGVRCLLITGAGKAFCAGADLAENMESGGSRDAGADLMETYHPILLELAELRMPVISAVNGAAAGAGMSIAIAADIVIAADTAYFLQAFINIGLVPDAGSTYILPRLIGEARAKAMMMLGEKVPASKAEEWGMIYKTVPESQLMTEASQVAEKLASAPTQALSSIRELLSSSSNNSFSEQLHAEAMAQRKASRSEDCLEGISAFLQKRAANFTGR